MAKIHALSHRDYAAILPAERRAYGRRRRDQESEDANHERWLISYADFITLLFAFFVVMYAVSSVNEGRYRVLSNALSDAFSGVHTEIISPGTMVPTTPYVLRRPESIAARLTRTEHARMQDIAQQLSKALAILVRNGQIHVTNSVRGVAVEINASVLFAPAQCDLQPASIPILKTISTVLTRFPDLIQVEGHTDDLPISTAQFPSNWELSSARAGSVVRFFVDHDIAPTRLSAAGYAQFRPVASNETSEGRARNRRVTLIILPADPKDRADDAARTKAEAASAGAVQTHSPAK